MADIFSTVVAGAQALDYSLQFSEVLRRCIQANGNKKRYQQSNQELIQILEKISKSPLQEDDITKHSQHLIDKVQEIDIPSQAKRRDRFIATMSFAFKQKQHEEDSVFLEQQKTNLGLHISNSNTHILREISDILNKVINEQYIPQQTSLPTIPENQNESTLPSAFQHHKSAKDQQHCKKVDGRDVTKSTMLNKYVDITEYKLSY